MIVATIFAILAPHAIPPQEIEIRELLAIDPVARGRRSPVVVDPWEARVVRGTFKLPTEGTVWRAPGGTERTWKKIAAGENGVFGDSALRGGWAWTSIEHPRDEVLLLDAQGPRRVFVNGVPRGGDFYSLGILRLPVRMHAGTNVLLFRGGRGALRAKLAPPPAAQYVDTRDLTLPDVLRGEADPLLLGVRIGNATDAWVEGMTAVVRVDGIEPTTTALPALAPLDVRKLPLWLELTEAPAEDELELTIELQRNGDVVHAEKLVLVVRDSRATHKRTFLSAIDGSVQYYAVVPLEDAVTAGAPDQLPALVLSLHGASVEAWGQASCYRARDWCVIVAPTNRRPFGFDWEDWGRLDALEVFELAKARYGTDPDRQYLTGHSMGGHGTWNLGVHMADTFAALAPSAGWRDFWGYAGGSLPAEGDPVLELFERAVGASRTLELEENFLHNGIYVLHGDEDSTVGIDQARFMRERLAAFHPNFAYYERAGAGHWWGNECMDWPPLFSFLKENVRAPVESARTFSFATVNPALRSECRWLAVETQLESMRPSRVEASIDPQARRVELGTVNVARIRLELAPFLADTGTGTPEAALEAGAKLTVEIDEQALELELPPDGVVRLASGTEGWAVAAPLSASSKGPHRAGPFKDAFRGRMLFVHGTQGSNLEARLLFEQARLASDVWAYRGNGSVELVPDTRFDPAREVDRHVVLFGNAATNGAWDALLGEAPIQVGSNAVRVGERSLEGDDLACLFLRPRPGSDTATVAAIAPTGPTGTRLIATLPWFVSGVGYPDWAIIGADMLESGRPGFRAAGFFGNDWRLETGASAWR